MSGDLDFSRDRLGTEAAVTGVGVEEVEAAEGSGGHGVLRMMTVGDAGADAGAGVGGERLRREV